MRLCASISWISSVVCRRVSASAARRLCCASTNSQATTPMMMLSEKNTFHSTLETSEFSPCTLAEVCR